MSDISETNNPRFCSFIFTESHLQDCGSGCNKRLLSVVVLIDMVDTVAFCVLTIKLLNVTQLHELDFFFFTKYKIASVEKGNYVQQHSCYRFQHAGSIKGHLIPPSPVLVKAVGQTDSSLNSCFQVSHIYI